MSRRRRAIEADVSAGSGALRIMCLNGWGGRLYEELADYLAAEAPDVLCLQEVVHTPAAAKPVLDYRDGDKVLPQRARLFGDLRRRLPDHAATFCPAAQGVLWDGGVALPSQWGLATFVRADLPVIAQAQGFVHKDYSPHGYGDHPRSRNAHVVRLYDYERDAPLTIAHMHGLRDPAGKGDTPERDAQAQRFLELIGRVAAPNDRLVACGDFNVEPESRTLAALTQRGLRDLVTGGGHRDTRTSHYPKSGRFADYLLVNDRVEVLKFEVVAAPEVSDHRPLVLEL